MVFFTMVLCWLGVMFFGSLRWRIYQEAEIDFMRQVARQVAVAVDNVLHDESARSAQGQLTHERDLIRLLLEVNNAVVSHLDLDELFTAVSTCLQKVIPHDCSGLVLCDQETRRYRVHVVRIAKNESYIQEGGVDTQLNALDADRDLFSAELSLAQTKRNELLALVLLYKALGGGWLQ